MEFLCSYFVKNGYQIVLWTVLTVFFSIQYDVAFQIVVLVLINTRDLFYPEQAINFLACFSSLAAIQKPRFNEKCFELSSDRKHGKVCLVYKNGKTISLIL